MTAARWSPLGVPCAACRAGIDDPCVTPSGQFAALAHRPRKDAAMIAAALPRGYGIILTTPKGRR